MLSYVVTYIGGLLTGVILLLAHQACVRRAVSQQRRTASGEVQRLNRRIQEMQKTIEEQKEDLIAYECSSAAASAREQGKITGIRQGYNMTEAERLQYALQGDSGRRNVKMGGKQ